MTNQTECKKLPDGTYEMRHCGALAGWARKAAHPPDVGGVLWRALSARGEIRHVRSLDAALDALLEMYRS